MGCFSSEVHRDRRSRSTGAEGEVPQAPSNRSAASSPSGTRHDDEKHPIRCQIAVWGPLVLPQRGIAVQAPLLQGAAAGSRCKHRSYKAPQRDRGLGSPMGRPTARTAAARDRGASTAPTRRRSGIAVQAPLLQGIAASDVQSFRHTFSSTIISPSRALHVHRLTLQVSRNPAMNPGIASYRS